MVKAIFSVHIGGHLCSVYFTNRLVRPRKQINEVRDESDLVYDPSFDADAASSIAFYTTNMLPR